MALFTIGGSGKSFSQSGISMKLTGDKAALRKLQRMSLAIQRRLTRKAADSAMRIARKKARSSAPVETGELRRQLDIRTKTYAKSGVVIAVVGPKRTRTDAGSRRLLKQANAEKAKFRDFVSTGSSRTILKRFVKARNKIETQRVLSKKALGRVPANYFHLVELGTKRGVSATHFLERTLRRNHSVILGKFRSILRRGILREAAKKG